MTKVLYRIVGFDDGIASKWFEANVQAADATGVAEEVRAFHERLLGNRGERPWWRTLSSEGTASCGKSFVRGASDEDGTDDETAAHFEWKLA